MRGGTNGKHPPEEKMISLDIKKPETKKFHGGKIIKISRNYHGNVPVVRITREHIRRRYLSIFLTMAKSAKGTRSPLTATIHPGTVIPFVT
jgi:hypothetical protein